MSIDLEDTSKDYEYNGKYMRDDIITGIVINGELTKVKVKAIEEQKNNYGNSIFRRLSR